ncbi:hypothetical protein AO368_1565 [Moraxella catarrhalis]|nr:hypothetical protein AO368_1565 [Moraxella catarrhalis]
MPNKSECNSVNIRRISTKSTQRPKKPKAHQLGGLSLSH